jgi:hypothetical protein
MIKRTQSTLRLTPAADYTEKVGYGVTISGEVATLGASATVQNRGIILEGGTVAQEITVGILGAIAGHVEAKLGGTVAKGDLLIQKNDGTWVTDTGSGARVSALVALEAGVSGDLIEAAPLTPITLA